jgi:thymidylate synthase ThyX
VAKRVQPKVFLVGYSGIDMEGLKEYLAYTGQEDFLRAVQEARSLGLNDGDILSSFYAKLCYQTLVPGRNDNVQEVRDIARNVRATLLQGHGSVFEHFSLNFVVTDCSRVYCYHPDAEVMAEDGWRRVSQLRAGDVVLTLDPDTRLAHWRPVLSMHVFPYEGSLHGWATHQCVSPLLTPDHLLWAAPCPEESACLTSDLAVRQARKLPVSQVAGKAFVLQHRIVKDDDWHGDTVRVGERCYPAGPFFSWLGFVAADGVVPQSCPDRVFLHAGVSSPVLTSLHSLLSGLFPGRWQRSGPCPVQQKFCFTVDDPELARFVQQHVGAGPSLRRFSRWLLDAEARLLRRFLAAAVVGSPGIASGHGRAGRHWLFCANPAVAGQWQYLAARLGLDAPVSVCPHACVFGVEHPDGGTGGSAVETCYRVGPLRPSAAGFQVLPQQQFTLSYRGEVYCPRTQDGLVYVRGSGRPFWCGNTHEQVRHRAGWAYSQTSGRYCRGAELRLVADPVLEPIQHLLDSHAEGLEASYRLWCDRMGLNGFARLRAALAVLAGVEEVGLDIARWEAEHLGMVPGRDGELELPPGLRKKITSALRRYLPCGLANEMGMSCNIRALRHVIALRTHRSSEWEMRVIFGQVYEIVKKKYPGMVADAREFMYDGLLEVAGMKHQPYELDAGHPEALRFYTSDQLAEELDRRYEENAAADARRPGRRGRG